MYWTTVATTIIITISRRMRINFKEDLASVSEWGSVRAVQQVPSAMAAVAMAMAEALEAAAAVMQVTAWTIVEVVVISDQISPISSLVVI
jgi:hypothetical protein